MIERAVPPLTDAERVIFVAAARSFIGVRWRHQGRNARGLDCAGLVVMSLRAIGYAPHDLTGYTRRPYRQALDAAIRCNFGEPLAADTSLRVGDVTMLRDGSAAPNHVGIIGDGRHGPTLIHAYAIDRKVIETRLSDDWRAKIVGVFR